MRARSRDGFTLVELVVSIAILSVIGGSMAMLLRSVQNTNDSMAAAAALESRGYRIMDNILRPLRTAAAGTLAPSPAPPTSTSDIQFQPLEQGAGGAVIAGGLERIRLDPATGAVVWTQDLGLASERSVTWCRGVPALAEGELGNPGDDNGNGLDDEEGLSITVEGNLVIVRLTLTSEGPRGELLTRSFEGRVFHRN